MKDWNADRPTALGWYWTRTPAGAVRLLEVVTIPRGSFRVGERGDKVHPELAGLALRFDQEGEGPHHLDTAFFDGWEWRGPFESHNAAL